jgi:hypothetical protein
VDLTNPQDWAQGVGAFKNSLDALATAFKLIKDFRSSGKASPAEATLVDRALHEAEKASKVAEAQLAKALGYHLCNCQFPPTAMLTVGSRELRGTHKVEMVFECPKCGIHTAGPWALRASRHRGLPPSPLPRFNSPDGHSPAVTLSTLHAAGKLVQSAVQSHELRHDGRQDHRDMSAGLASDPEVIAQECSFTDGCSWAAPKFLGDEVIEGASLRGP